ncbi:MAG: hemin uptake protein HemP [Bacteroidota bacterium]
MTAPPKTPPSPASTANAPPRPCVGSEQILRGNNSVEIEHAGQRYLLRVTRENKLILTK